jgi:hypothetical protein
MTQNTVDIRLLRSIYAENEDFRDIFDYFADRQRNSKETRPESLIAAIKRDTSRRIERRRIIEFFRLLERARCGKYIEGRLGHPSRFSWDVGLVSVGQAARGDVRIVEGNAHDDMDEAAEPSTIRPASRTHRYHLRPDLEMSIELPADLTILEASRLADFVKTLPFSESPTPEPGPESSRP